MSKTIKDILGKIPVSKPDVHGAHPFVNPKNHALLLAYIQERMEFGNTARQQLLGRYEAIDKDVSAYMVLSDDEKKRRNEQIDGKGPKGVSMHVPFVLLQLDDALTYFLNVFAPETGMFQSIGKKADQDVLNTIVELMNNHADHQGYFRQILKFCFDCMKYNLGGIRTQWETQFGNVIVNNESNQAVAQRSMIWHGNDMECIDMYNIIWDPSCHPIDVSRQGEFVAEIEMITPFRLRKLAMDGAYTNVDRITEPQSQANLQSAADAKYYKVPPQLWDGQTGSNSGEGVDWTNILSQGNNTDTLGVGIELWHMTIQIPPKEFGLAKAIPGEPARLETWRITVADGNHVIAATHLPNSHGRLPYNFACPMEDNLGFAQKSVAEILAPFQSLGSFLVNTHMSAVRKNIWDLTLYDPSIIPLDQLESGDVAGRVAINPAGYGKDINKAVWQNSNVLDTKEAMNQLAKVIDLMQLLWPTTASANQIANIDRAVEEQVTTTVTNSNRRLQKAAKLIDVQALAPSRAMMISNIQEYQQELTLVNSEGNDIKIDPSTLRGKDYSAAIGQGLKSMDKAAVTRFLQKLITTILQSPDAAAEFDLPGLINALSTSMDMRIDLDQYRKKPVAPQGEGGAAGTPAAGATIPQPPAGAV